MKRAGLVIALVLSLLAAPFTAEAQLAGKVYRIGYLSPASVLATLVDRSNFCVKSFVGGLQELGYTEGHNLLLVPRSAEGSLGQLPELAVELARLGVDGRAAI